MRWWIRRLLWGSQLEQLTARRCTSVMARSHSCTGIQTLIKNNKQREWEEMMQPECICVYSIVYQKEKKWKRWQRLNGDTQIFNFGFRKVVSQTQLWLNLEQNRTIWFECDSMSVFDKKCKSNKWKQTHPSKKKCWCSSIDQNWSFRRLLSSNPVASIQLPIVAYLTPKIFKSRLLNKSFELQFHAFKHDLKESSIGGVRRKRAVGAVLKCVTLWL